MIQRLDSVIVGSGISNLACAMVLLRQGRCTAFSQKSGQINRSVKTGHFIEPGFCRDRADMARSLPAGPFFQDYCYDLANAGLSFMPFEACFRDAFRNRIRLGLSNHANLSAHRIEKLSNSDYGSKKTNAAAFFNRAQHPFSIRDTPCHLFPFAKIAWRLWRKAGLGGSVDLMRFLQSAARLFGCMPFGQKSHNKNATVLRGVGTGIGARFLHRNKQLS